MNIPTHNVINMRLLNVKTLQLKFFETFQTPRYAILSHTWGKDEVTYQELLANSTFPLSHRQGWAKIIGTCDKAAKDNFEWVWIDTCCIDKTSSAELSEAINSMFTWYRLSEVCYALLEDVEVVATTAGTEIPEDKKSFEQRFSKARWFTRGWTLQELVAPEHVEFCATDWKTLGTKASLCDAITRITGIDKRVLMDPSILSTLSIAHRFSWAADRQTSRLEDIAYCLMGVFNISMPLLYGEGSKAFIRLQEEIVKNSEDQSIFAWDYSHHDTTIYDVNGNPVLLANDGIFAEHPIVFKHSKDLVPIPSDTGTYDITNRGLRIDAPVRANEDLHDIQLLLFCHPKEQMQVLAIPLRQDPTSENRYYRDSSKTISLVPDEDMLKAEYKTIYVHKFGTFHRPQPMSRSIFLRYFPMSIMRFNEGLYADTLRHNRIPDVDTFKLWNFHNEKLELNPRSQTFMVVLTFEFFECRGKIKVYMAVLITVSSAGPDTAGIYFFMKEKASFRYMLDEITKGNKKPESTIRPSRFSDGATYRFGAVISRQALSNEVVCVVDIKPERLHL